MQLLRSLSRPEVGREFQLWIQQGIQKWSMGSRKKIYMRAEKLLAQNNNDVVVTMQLALLPPPPSVSSELASNDNAMRAIVSDYLQRGLERRRRRV